MNPTWNIMIRTIIFGLVMTCIDIPWIKFVMSKLYRNVFTIDINIFATIVAYLCMILTYPFIISKFHKLKEQLEVSAILGLVIFGTYGFTLAAIYNKYPLSTALFETIWGIILYSTTTLITYYIVKRLSLK